MLKKKIIAVFGCSMISSVCSAGPATHHHSAHRYTTQESAIEFVNKYYAHMNRGMSRKHLDGYWTEDKVEEFDKLTVSIAEKTGKNMVFESQRLMDLQNMEARCEEIELTKTKTYGASSRKAKLEYIVNNNCESWKDPFNRTITLRFSANHKHWLIDAIEDGEKR